MLLSEACCLAQDLTGVLVTPLPEVEDRVTFCARHRFHPAQEYLLPQALERLFSQLAPGELLLALDHFQIRFVFLQAGETPVVIGPYCTEFFSLNDCAILLRQRGLSLPPRDLLAWRGALPVKTESDVLHIARALLHNLQLEPAHTTRRIGFDNAVVEVDEAASHKTYTQLVQERYRNELQFMENIQNGNAQAAIENWQRLHHSVAYLKRLGQPIEMARMAAAMTRTVMRIAAMQIGLPALLNDQISGESAAVVREATSIDAIDREHLRLIREYCRAIRTYRDSGHSSLVLSAMYHIERHFAEDVTVAGLAQELEVSPGYLTALFRKEVGQPPGAYLMKTRLRVAARLLQEGAVPIQQVSGRVGIPDANYFAKLFKREYGQTPTHYRKTHKI